LKFTNWKLEILLAGDLDLIEKGELSTWRITIYFKASTDSKAAHIGKLPYLFICCYFFIPKKIND